MQILSLRISMVEILPLTYPGRRLDEKFGDDPEARQQAESMMLARTFGPASDEGSDEDGYSPRLYCNSGLHSNTVRTQAL